MKKEAKKVAIVGTGMVGMSYAYAMLNQNGCDEMVLIDINKRELSVRLWTLTTVLLLHHQL